MFIRSTAAGGRLGGLAPATRAAAGALAVAFDVVVIETVGVGQSETEVADVADTVAVVVQPGSGDVLQFLKAGIMEVPDVLVVTKADLGAVATRAMSDLQAALLALGARPTPSLRRCRRCHRRPGIEQLAQALEAPPERSTSPTRRQRARRRHALENFTVEHGERGLRALGGRLQAERWLEPSRIRRSTSRRSSGPWRTARASAGSGPSVRGVRRRQGVARRIVLPAEPLVDGPTALRAWRDSDLDAAGGRLPGPRDLALDAGAVPLRPRPTPATTCSSATTRSTPAPRRRSRSSAPRTATSCSARSR